MSVQKLWLSSPPGFLNPAPQIWAHLNRLDEENVRKKTASQYLQWCPNNRWKRDFSSLAPYKIDDVIGHGVNNANMTSITPIWRQINANLTSISPYLTQLTPAPSSIFQEPLIQIQSSICRWNCFEKAHLMNKSACWYLK